MFSKNTQQTSKTRRDDILKDNNAPNAEGTIITDS